MKRRTFDAVREAPLEVVLAEVLEISPKKARALVGRGAVYLAGRRAQLPQTVVPKGARLSVVLEEGGAPVTARAAPPPALSVLYEDDDLLVVDKPAGVVAQPTPGRRGDSLLDLASRYLGFPAGLAHRLDKDTSGVTVFGKHAHATSMLAREFREGRARKRYLAVTGPGLPPQGTVDVPLSKDPSRPGRWRALANANGIPAVTHYVRLVQAEQAIVALYPETGRTHQLRAHLASLGFPIVGDHLYGGADGPRCLLHAQGLKLDTFLFEAPIPSDLAEIAARLGAVLPSGDW